MTTVLSIQSSVAYGHVGNSAAVFPMQRLGVEVVAVDTVHFSNHAAYETVRGPMHAPDEVRAVLAGVSERGVLARCDAVLSGYLGTAEVGEVVLEAVRATRAAHPATLYCCDPVLGDRDRGFFVRPGIPAFVREKLVPAADVVTPNHFELDVLTGREEPTRTRDEVLAAAREIRARGPRTVLVTSVVHDAVPTDRVAMLAVADDGVWEVDTPRLEVEVGGTGDLTAALFLTHLLTLPTRTALEHTAASVAEVLGATVRAGADEMRLVEAQEAIAHPPPTVRARHLAG